MARSYWGGGEVAELEAKPHCEHCHAELPPAGLVCPQCGRPQYAQPTKRVTKYLSDRTIISLLIPISIVGFILVALLSKSNPPVQSASSGGSGKSSYAQEMRTPMGNLGLWIPHLRSFLEESAKGNPIVYWCNTKGYAQVSSEGSQIVRQLGQITPPSDLATAHGGLQASIRSVLGSMAAAEVDLCINGDIPAATTRMDEITVGVRGMTSWLQVMTEKMQ